jgi:molybdopterin synthase sulfur carrier subunit
MASVHLPSSLALVIPELPRVATVEGATVGAVVAALDARWPGVADRVLEPGPAIRRHINIFVDGDPASLTTPVGKRSVVHVIPAVAGGAIPRFRLRSSRVRYHAPRGMCQVREGAGDRMRSEPEDREETTCGNHRLDHRGCDRRVPRRHARPR